MKYILIMFLIPVMAFSQNPGFELLKKINGVEIFYKTTKTKSDKKKDSWVIEFEFINNTDKDIFYSSITTNPASAGKIFGDNEKIRIDFFGSASIKNVKGIFSDSATSFRGDKTRLATDSGEVIYTIKKGKTYTSSIVFTTEKEITPIVSYNVQNSISFNNDLYSFL